MDREVLLFKEEDDSQYLVLKAGRKKCPTHQQDLIIHARRTSKEQLNIQNYTCLSAYNVASSTDCTWSLVNYKGRILLF